MKPLTFEGDVVEPETVLSSDLLNDGLASELRNVADVLVDNAVANAAYDDGAVVHECNCQ